MNEFCPYDSAPDPVKEKRLNQQRVESLKRVADNSITSYRQRQERAQKYYVKPVKTREQFQLVQNEQ